MHELGLRGMTRRIYTYPEGLGWETLNLISTIGVFIIVPGIGVFVYNAIKSYRDGEPAGPNPWGADSLEWAVPSPPAEHGWSIVPIVHSRHPLWDQEELHSGPEPLERFTQALARWPLRWRAAVIVGTADARPREVFRVADPSIWPLVAACGTVLIFLAELVKLRWGILLGVVIATAAIIRWNWPTQPPMTVEEEDAFERDTGVAVNAGGSVVVAAWGMGLMILFVAICFATLMLAYFYLRLENPVWPGPGVGAPGLLWAGLAGALVVAAATAMSAALARLRSDDQRGFVLGLSVVLGLAVVGVVVQVRDLFGLGIGWTEQAYTSIFMTLAGFVVLVQVGAIVMVTMTLFWALRGLYTGRRHANVVNITRFVLAAAAMWVIGFATLYLGPVLT